MFIITGSRIRHAIDSPRSSSMRPRAAASLNGTTWVCRATSGGDAKRHRRRGRRVAPAHRVGVRDDREHHRVVVTVVRALDLDDVVATGRGPGDADGVHRRLGAGVAEAHFVEVEAPAELFRERDRGLGRDREVRSGAGGPFDRLDDLRVRMADDVGAEATVKVDGTRCRRRRRGASPCRARCRPGTDLRPGTTSRPRTACASRPARRAPSTSVCGRGAAPTRPR